MNRLFVVLMIASFAAAGCGTGNNENSNTNNMTSNNTTSNNTTSDNNTTSNNTTSDNNTTSNNTTSNNTTPMNVVNTREEPYITQFRYYEEKQSALGPTKEGFTIGVLGLTIENEDGNSKTMTEADRDAFESAHLTAATIDGMRNGWGCRDTSGGDDMGGGADMGTDMGSEPLEESTFWFEARIQEAGNEREIQEITGCVEDMDAAVLDIITDLEALGQQYL